MILSKRQVHVLQLIADDLRNNRRWDDRVLSGEPTKPGQQGRITWEEMLWLSEIAHAAMTNRIEAMLLVSKVVKESTSTTSTKAQEIKCL